MITTRTAHVSKFANGFWKINVYSAEGQLVATKFAHSGSRVDIVLASLQATRVN